MKHPRHSAVTATAVAAALIFGAAAWSSARRADRTGRENENLRRQIIKLQTAAGLPDTERHPEHESEPASGELAMLQELLEEPPLDPAENPQLTYAERLEQMKLEDPDRYEQFIGKTEQRQQKLKYYLAERTALFVDLDTSLMTEKELEIHNQLVDGMSEIWDLMGRMKHPAESDNRDVMREMTGRMRKMGPLLKKERNTMLKLMAHDLGYNVQETRQFTDRINAIHEYTTLNSAKIKKK